jgi:hypothetical protein
MARNLALLLTLMAGICAMAHAEGEPKRMSVMLPTDWKDAAKFRLVVEGVTVPGNQALKFRVTTTNELGREVFLGSLGVEALDRDESKPRRLPALRFDITRALKQFLENRGSAQKIELAIHAVDGSNKPIQGLKWSVDAARIETLRK